MLQRRVKTLADSKQVKNCHNNPQQPDTQPHIYVTWVKGSWKQRESLLYGKIQKDRITKYSLYDVRF